jgi:hypothetical protein
VQIIQLGEKDNDTGDAILKSGTIGGHGGGHGH